MAWSPASALPLSPRRFESRIGDGSGLLRDRQAIAEAMAQGLNASLAACNLAMATRHAAQADLPAQSVMDWRRSWKIALCTPDGQIHDLLVDPEGKQASLRQRGTGKTHAVDLRPGQDPGSVARLASALGVAPERILRIATVLAQTEFEPAEAVLAKRSALSRSFGVAAQASAVGGERIVALVQLGDGQEADTIELQLDRDGQRLHALSVTHPDGRDDLIDLDRDQSFIHWQMEARIDAKGRAHVSPHDVHIEYSLVERMG